jgi:hypothetical protein
MRATVAASAVRTHQKPVPSGLDDVTGKAGKVRMGSDDIRTDQNGPELDEDSALLALLDQARIRAGMSWKEMQINARVPKGQWSEAYNGVRGNFAWLWVMRQPKKYQEALRKIVDRHFNLTTESRIEADADRISELVGLLVKRMVVDK